jgi:cullin-associated NEDD8-dissociated protein 1
LQTGLEAWSAAMANTNITGILEKMIGKDKDYRYMATSDLLGELNKESFKADQDLESKLTNIVIQQLEDASGDVSGLAVKCLAPLVKKVGGDRAVEMTTKLCDKLLNGKDQHRDTASIALKTIIMEVTVTSLAEKILVSLAPQLINGVTGGKSAEIKCECLDILCDVLHRFGNLITKDHANMLTALLTQLSSTQASVRKKSVSCIGKCTHARLHFAVILIFFLLIANDFAIIVFILMLSMSSFLQHRLLHVCQMIY